MLLVLISMVKVLKRLGGTPDSSVRPFFQFCITSFFMNNFLLQI